MSKKRDKNTRPYIFRNCSIGHGPAWFYVSTTKTRRVVPLLICFILVRFGLNQSIFCLAENLKYFNCDGFRTYVMVYLDYNSTTPVDQRVIDEMIPVFKKKFGNPSSTHDSGMDAMDLIDDAREKLAILIGADKEDVIFTSGATEANNMAIAGIGLNIENNHRILYGATEHKSVIEPCNFMKRFGSEIFVIPVKSDGVIDLDVLSEKIEPETDVVSIMLANSETGVINPIKEISKIVHDAGAILHSDITQAAGKIPVDIHDLGIDISTCSSHKMYGPKGVGAFVASRHIRKSMTPLIYGGGQEKGLRSGTQNVSGIVGFGKACQIAYEIIPKESAKLLVLRDNLESRIKSLISNVTINGENTERLPNTSSIRIHGAQSDAVIVNTKHIEISSGSACSSNTMEPSHVLTAMGLDRTAADESIRVSVGRHTEMKDIETAAIDIAQAAEFVRKKEAEITENLR